MISREERLRAAEERVKQNFDSRESGGKQGMSVLDFSVIGGYKKGIFYRPVDRQFNRIDIIPFIVTSENYPQKTMIGKPDYVLDLWIHRYVGPGSNNHVVCLSRTYGKPCPICEENDKLKEINRDLPEKERLKPNNPKRRCWYCVVDLDVPEKDQHFQIFEESHFLFEKHLLLAATTRGGGFVPFFDIEEGKTIEFYANEQKSQEGKFFNYERIMMVDRPAYPESILKEAFPLDQMMVCPTYDQVRAIYYGDEAPSAQGRATREEPREPDRGRRAPEPERVPERAPITRERRPEPEPEPGPTGPARTRERRPESEPTRTRERQCSFGHVMGKDNNEFADCSKCPADEWDECNDLAQKTHIS